MCLSMIPWTLHIRLHVEEGPNLSSAKQGCLPLQYLEAMNEAQRESPCLNFHHNFMEKAWNTADKR